MSETLEIQKAAQGLEGLSPDEAEMAQINGYTLREFSPEEVFTFRAILCDNEIDRDGDAFTAKALGQLAKLFVGKTVISDHNHRAEKQQARIYRAQAEEVPGKTSKQGEPYTRLTARCYMPRNDDTGEDIALLEAGILREMSVGCVMGKTTCSICGKEWGRPWEGPICAHLPGETYEGKQCCRLLEEAMDAYEASFVAVPAQPLAGVTKGKQQETDRETEALIRSAKALLKKMEDET